MVTALMDVCCEINDPEPSIPKIVETDKKMRETQDKLGWTSLHICILTTLSLKGKMIFM
jgi:hypothetical protein